MIVNADLAYAHGNLFRGTRGSEKPQNSSSQRDPKLAKKLEKKPHS